MEKVFLEVNTSSLSWDKYSNDGFRNIKISQDFTFTVSVTGNKTTQHHNLKKKKKKNHGGCLVLHIDLLP